MPDWRDELKKANKQPTDQAADVARRAVALGAAKDDEATVVVDAVRAIYFPTNRDRAISDVFPILLRNGYRDEAEEVADMVSASTILKENLRARLAEYDSGH